MRRQILILVTLATLAVSTVMAQSLPFQRSKSLEWTRPAKKGHEKQIVTCPTCLSITPAPGVESTTVTVNWINTSGPMTTSIVWISGMGSVLIDCDTILTSVSVSATNGADVQFSLEAQQPEWNYQVVSTSDTELVGTTDTVITDGCNYMVTTYVSDAPTTGQYACDSIVSLYGIGGYVHEMTFPVGSGQITIDFLALWITDTVQIWGANGLLAQIVLGYDGPYTTPIIWQNGVATPISVGPGYSPLTESETAGFGRIILDVQNNCALRLIVRSNESDATIWHVYVHCCPTCTQPPPVVADRNLVLCLGETWLGNAVTGDTIIAELGQTAGLCDSTTYWHITVPVVAITGFDLTGGVLCNGDTNASVQVLPMCDDPFTIEWNTGEDSSIASNLSSGTYTVTLTDINGCTAMDSIIIDQPPVLAVTLTPSSPTCYGYPDGSLLATVTGGTEPYDVYWSNDDNDLHNNLITAGVYSVTVTDANGCESVVETELEQPDSIRIETDIIDASCADIADGTAFVAATGGTGDITYIWSTDDTGASADSLLADHEYSVTATDAHGCTSNQSVTLDFQHGDAVYAPNAFSPNRDGTNDTFMLYLGDCVVEVVELQIYDRWGELVFTGQNLTDPSQGWNGMFRGQYMDPAVFTWRAIVRSSSGITYPLAGDVHLMK